MTGEASVPTPGSPPDSALRPGRRVCVIGTSGSGKTHVARALAQRLRIPYISNDALIWGPNWTPVPKDAVLVAMDEAMRQPAWTFDGNLTLTRPEDRLALERCDTLVWLDLPRWQTFSQVTLRTLRRVFSREELWHGNRESLRTMLSSDSIILWSITSYSRRRREYAALFGEQAPAGVARIRLRSRRRVNAWLSSVGC